MRSIVDDNKEQISDTDRIDWLSKRTTNAVIHHEDGNGIIRLSRDNLDQKLFDIRSFIDDAMIIEELPKLARGEVFFDYCKNCGMDFLSWPGKCSVCSSKQYIKLGAMQGVIWRSKKLPRR